MEYYASSGNINNLAALDALPEKTVISWAIINKAKEFNLW